MDEAIIETRGLRRLFGDKAAVEDLSLSVRRGEIFGFLGPNGAGKTTSVKMLLGLVAPSAGSGRVLGAPLGDRRARTRLGFLPEHFRFQDWLTGRELLRFHGRLYGLSGAGLEARSEELLARVDLLDAADRPIRTYSKGMTQRIGLAQALLNRPELVFLDEPTSGLDPLGRFLVRDIIRELKAEGAAVFLNSHLLGEVEATCDRVAFVKAGRTVHELSLAGGGGVDVEISTGPLEDGAFEELRRFGPVERLPPAAGFRVAAGRDASSGAERRFPGDAAAGPECRFRVQVSDDSALPELARMLVRRGVDVYELRTTRKSLEAWFLEVMGDEERPG